MSNGRSTPPAVPTVPDQAEPRGSERRQELLDIAAELFATKGYAQTTVRDVAQHAGILSGSLYHHFASKEEMFHEILREFLDHLHDSTMTAVANSTTSTELIDRLVADAFTAIQSWPYAVALYQKEAGALSTQPSFAYLDTAGKEVEAVWRSAIVKGQESGEFRSDLDARLVYRFIRDTVWSSVRWYRPGGRIDAAQMTRQYLVLLHGGLRAG